MTATNRLKFMKTIRYGGSGFHRSQSEWLRAGLIAIGLILILVSWVNGQSVGKIAGSVRDAKTGDPLPGANVVVVGTLLGAAADVNGEYYILNIPPGKYELRASMMGYEKMKVVDVIVHVNRTTRVDFKLEESVLEFGEVVVQATRPDVERDKTSTSSIVRFDDVQLLPGIRDIGDIIQLAVDVIDGHFRGGREGEEYYLLQGMGIVNPLDRSTAFQPIMSGVEEVEVITSGFGAQYGNAQSGIVNISMKEGDPHHWWTRLESRVRAPGRKHFGPSVFDPNANDYIRLLLNEQVWLRGDPSADLPQPYYGSMASGLTGSFAGDTLVQLAVAQALWQQTRRDIGRIYGNELDNSLELATGGPIDQRTRLFIAGRSNRRWSVFPTEGPNVEYQGMGNIVTDLGSGATVRLSAGLNHLHDYVFPGSNNVGGYQRWLWDRITGVRERKKVNAQFGVRVTKTVSPSSFYELKVNSLFTHNRLGATPVPPVLPDSVDFNWVVGTIAYPNNNSPDRLNYQMGYDSFTDERTRTISVDGAWTSQITKAHLLNAGIQLNSYGIDVSNFLNIRSSRQLENYTAKPFEAAIYIQDKMEFEGLIASVGLRFDLWYSGKKYYPDLYTPFGDPDSLGRFHPSQAVSKKPPIYGRLQPRLGFSFPISVRTVFHLNYGAFMQRPAFQYIVSTRLGQRLNDPIILGNPRLEPETTNSYDIGVVQALTEGITLDISGYYKDVKNLIQQSNFIDERAGYQVSSYFNLDYADIRGFRIALNKRRGNLTGSINYQFSYATGKSATATAATPIFNRDTLGVVTTDLTNVPTRDILLDFDRTHNLIVTISYTTGREWGPALFGGKPLAELAVSLHSSLQSGRPYTSPFDIRLINVKRTPMEFNTNLRLTKTLRHVVGLSATIYGEIYNLFNNKILNYDYLFQRPTATNPNLPLQYYELYPINDRQNGIRYWWDKGRQGPFSVDQSFLIYSNQPRSYQFGLVVEF
ncbi:MAG: TonB-dependent receptor [candidate division KSB1 bacterium]|nr:TonB-dependent receptor [candidate division KSB1 bacterium]MDZ7336034.1 TonB-dependent receptor [candidate division KSB1 bacterium]MDZ7358036.1 TonB-dependent receptor [candidate division KSB1 bacterium]MDZ7375350.1 TonB-dependent receptor [candidate division KSB1 bacterium]MDZ7401086.1 TonB-dependent receptor [candidate division KSB1 bacterium]